jgi:hypothetical protein
MSDEANGPADLPGRCATRGGVAWTRRGDRHERPVVRSHRDAGRSRTDGVELRCYPLHRDRTGGGDRTGRNRTGGGRTTTTCSGVSSAGRGGDVQRRCQPAGGWYSRTWGAGSRCGSRSIGPLWGIPCTSCSATPTRESRPFIGTMPRPSSKAPGWQVKAVTSWCSGASWTRNGSMGSGPRPSISRRVSSARARRPAPSGPAHAVFVE